MADTASRWVRLGRYEFRPGLWPSLIVTALLVLLIGLGFWQLDRAEQKRALLQGFKDRPAEAAIRLHAGLEPRPEWRYRQTYARGTYDAAHQFLLDNRVHQGRAGYYILTPLRLANSDSMVLVNRGWVPQGRTRADLPELPVKSQGTVTVEGVIDFPAKNAFTLGEGEDRASGWPKVLQRVRYDLQASQLNSELLPLVVLLNPDQPDGFVREWTPIRTFGPARHIGYAVQWFALAVALVILFFWSVKRPVEEAGQAADNTHGDD